MSSQDKTEFGALPDGSGILAGADFELSFVATTAADGTPLLDELVSELRFVEDGETLPGDPMRASDGIRLRVEADGRQIRSEEEGLSLWSMGDTIVGLAELFPAIPADAEPGASTRWLVDRDRGGPLELEVVVVEWINVDGEPAVVLEATDVDEDDGQDLFGLGRVSQTRSMVLRAVVSSRGRLLHTAQAITWSTRVDGDGGPAVHDHGTQLRELRLLEACDGPTFPDFERVTSTSEDIVAALERLADAAVAGDADEVRRYLAPEVLAAHGDEAVDVLLRHADRLRRPAFGVRRSAELVPNGDEGMMTLEIPANARDAGGYEGRCGVRVSARPQSSPVRFSRISSNSRGLSLRIDQAEDPVAFEAQFDVLNVTADRARTIVDTLGPPVPTDDEVLAAVVALQDAIVGGDDAAVAAMFLPAVIDAHGAQPVAALLRRHFGAFGEVALTNAFYCGEDILVGSPWRRIRFSLYSGPLRWPGDEEAHAQGDAFARLVDREVRFQWLSARRSGEAPYPREPDPADPDPFFAVQDLLVITERTLFTAADLGLDPPGAAGAGAPTP